MELMSVFTSDPVFKVLHGRQELGTVNQITFLRHRGDEPVTLSLGGRSWLVTSVDWSRREAFVVPSKDKGKSQWQGGPLGLSYRLSRAIHALLVDESMSARWSARASAAIADQRAEYGCLRPGADVALVRKEGDEVRWFTFAGGVANTALADALRDRGISTAQPSDYWVKIPYAANFPGILAGLRQMSLEALVACFVIVDDYLENLKFRDCLPADLAMEILRTRLLTTDDIANTLGREVIEILDGCDPIAP